MPDNGYKWLKFHTAMLDETKLNRLKDRTKWRFIQLYLLAGVADAGGLLCQNGELLSINDMAYRLRAKPSTIEEDLSNLKEAGLLTFDNDGWVIPRFIDEQGPSMAEQRNKWNERQRRHREKVRKQNEESEEEEDEEEDRDGEEEVDLDLEKEKEEDKDKEVTCESPVTGEPHSQDKTNPVVVFSSSLSQMLKTFCLSQSLDMDWLSTELSEVVSDYGEDVTYDLFFRYCIEDNRMSVQKALNVTRKKAPEWELRPSQINSKSPYRQAKPEDLLDIEGWTNA
jgi:DNA-binding transcriptional regulator YhcF (GntR family)